MVSSPPGLIQIFQSLVSLISRSSFPETIRDKHVIYLDTGPQRPGLASLIPNAQVAPHRVPPPEGAGLLVFGEAGRNPAFVGSTPHCSILKV